LYLVRFEENGYSEDWVKEAEKRGLPNIKSCPVAFKQLLLPHNKALLTSLGIMTESELDSRYHILMEKYAKDLLIEANTLKSMVTGGVLPAAFAYRKELADGIKGIKEAGAAVDVEVKILKELSVLVKDLSEANEALEAAIVKVDGLHGEEQGELAGSLLTSLLEDVRSKADK
jgi:glutamine synthetase